jgi:DNA-binding NtrC family response regulator
MLVRVLLAIDNAKLRRRVQTFLREEDLLVNVVKDRPIAWERVEEFPTDILIVTRSVVPEPRASCIARVADAPNGPGLVVLSEQQDAREEAELVAAGADLVLHTGVPDAALRGALDTVIAARTNLLTKTLTARRAMLRPQLSDFVSSSPVMQQFMKTVYRVVDSDAPILVIGETGVGKERLARAIHAASRRSDGPFISVNCGAIPENLLESHLFGHEKGAFTGSTRAQRGCFELAHGGSIFLDEICEMPFHLQVKLLHVLQDFEVRPIGSEKMIPVNVRVVAATNRDIEQEVREKRFRQDLYYRLSVVSVRVPPLVERKEDIPTLAVSFLEDLSARVGRKVRRISPEAMRCLCDYSWPGNVRELINVLERAVLLCEGGEIAPKDFPDDIRAGAQGRPAGTAAPGGTAAAAQAEAWLDRPLREGREAAAAEFEKAYIVGLLRRTQGKIAETAERAGIEPRSLFTKMKRHGLRKEDFKDRAGA